MLLVPPHDRSADSIPQGTWRYISAELQVGMKDRGHLLRDDLESFVHVLFYYVFRYRPVFPANSVDHRRLLTSINAVFEANMSGSVHYWGIPGGYEKGQYLCSPGSHFISGKLRQHLRPEPLCMLVEEAREVFTPLYSNEPIVNIIASEQVKAERREELKAYEKALSAATERVESSAHMISVFRMWTEEYQDQWSADDGAVDQLAPAASTSTSGSSRKRSADADVEAACPSSKARRLAAGRSATAGASARAQSRSKQSR
jgi:hypothetical protein